MSMVYGFSPSEERDRRDNMTQKEIGTGFPVTAMTYDRGIVLVTKSPPIIEKISGLSDGIAFAGVGSYPDIRRVRERLRERSKTIGLGKVNHISARSLLDDKDGLIDSLGDVYRNIYGLPYAVDIVLVEAGEDGNLFYRVDYTGMPSQKSDFIVCGGTETADGKGTKQKIEDYIKKNGRDFSSLGLDDAARLSLDALASNLDKEQRFLDESRSEVLQIGVLEGRIPLKFVADGQLAEFTGHVKKAV